MEIGAQFYTIREFCNNLENFSESLKKIADIGYKNVQISGTCAYEAQWLETELRKNGLKCVLTHNPMGKICDNTEALISDHNVFNCDYVGLGGFVFDEDEEGKTIDDFARKFRPAINKFRNSGKHFMYHNHDREFDKVRGKLVIEHLANAFAPEEMGFTLDTYWVQAGGGDPAYWIERLSGRVHCIHLKDFKYGPKMAVVGEGNINFDRVFEKAEAAGTKYMLVEQDDCYGENPFDCLRRSYQYLSALGFK